MQTEAWIQLLKRIPPVYQDYLVIVTKFDREISVQTIVRFEEEYVLLRGRMAGTTDADRVYWIPYQQIGYLGFQRTVSEQLIAYLYGEGPAPELPASTKAQVEEPPPPEPEPVAAPEPEMVQLPSKNPTAPQMSDKAALLQRIRRRSQTNGPPRPNGEE